MATLERIPRLRRIQRSSMSVSLLTGTNSTVSGIRGPGRLVGRVLSAGGRRIEPVLSRAAEMLGYGPNVVARRLVALIRAQHSCGRRRLGDQVDEPLTELAADEGPPATPMQSLINIACHPCQECRGPILDVFAVNQEATGLLSKLLEYTL